MAKLVSLQPTTDVYISNCVEIASVVYSRDASKNLGLKKLKMLDKLADGLDWIGSHKMEPWTTLIWNQSYVLRGRMYLDQVYTSRQRRNSAATIALPRS